MNQNQIYRILKTSAIDEVTDTTSSLRYVVTQLLREDQLLLETPGRVLIPNLQFPQTPSAP